MWTTKTVVLGSTLPQLSRQWNIDLFRQRHEQVYGPGNVVAEAWPERNIHDDDDAARREGLSGAVGSAPQLVALVHRSMMLAFGAGWIAGGRFSTKMIKPLLPDDVTTVKGRVVGLSLVEPATPGDAERLRATCRVAVHRLDGTPLLVGTAEAIVAEG